MNIVVNAVLKKGGALQVADALIREFAKMGDSHRFLILYSEELASLLGDMTTYPSHMTFLKYAFKKSLYGMLFGKNAELDDLVQKFNADAVFSVFGPVLWKPAVPHICGYAIPHYLYRENRFITTSSLHYRLKLFIKGKFTFYIFSHFCDAIFCENQDVTTRLKLRLPDTTIETITNNCNPAFMDLNRQQAINIPPFDGVTLLTVSAFYPHKNLLILINVANYLSQTHPDFKFRFVITCDAPAGDIPPSVFFIGAVPIMQCPRLYKCCDFMILPTLLECFSASYAEAMYCKKPILTSDLSFAHSLCEDAAIYFDPYSPQSIGEAIYDLAHSPRIQQQLVQNGSSQLAKFDSSEQRANKILLLISKMIAKRNG